jgi:hypothetical protein
MGRTRRPALTGRQPKAQFRVLCHGGIGSSFGAVLALVRMVRPFKKKIKIHKARVPKSLRRHILPLPLRCQIPASETPPMNKTLEILLTALALCGLYCAVPRSTNPSNSVSRTQEAVMLADGSDPMPLCRAKGCGPIK